MSDRLTICNFQTPVPHQSRHLAPGVSAIGENNFDEREQSPRPAQQVESTVTVLNIGGINTTFNNKPSVSTRMCRLRPLIFLPAS